MQDIKPIETVYNGYRFRSRLEARWAVFFDGLGIEYIYEPEGYKLENGETYLPDFYLPKFDIYVEVKPKKTFEFIFDDGLVSEKNNNAGKYLPFANECTSNNHSFLIVQGDPYDCFTLDHVFLEHENRGTTDFFIPIYCLNKILFEVGDDEFVSSEFCNKNCKDCDEEFPKMGHSQFVGFDKNRLFLYSPKGTVYSNLSDKYEYIELNTLKKGDERPFKIAKQMHYSAKYSRQARFEHGEHPTTERRY